MRKFVTGVSGLVLKECHTAILNNEMNLSRLMIYAQQIKKDNRRERYRARALSSSSTPVPRGRLVQGNKSSMSRPQQSVSSKPNFSPCSKYSRTHSGECLVEKRGCFEYGKIGHRLRECPHARQESRDTQPQTQATSASASAAHPARPQGASSSIAGSQCQNRFYPTFLA
ncbi:uncharacterized protein LOC107841353 [Capsicum annuum]|uniref:uncharacterized protein LOC107841353 n=1 Tax=Capsicum annuum TaxID=4072 RepID=UPI0007BEDA40|nr:uncharacterized protein LOC107841353 [Capsicum annuum]